MISVTATPPVARRLRWLGKEASRSFTIMADSIEAQPVVRAPDFPPGLEWINTGGKPLTLGDLERKIALLDFWTYG
jgi:hypothetical protein